MTNSYYNHTSGIPQPVTRGVSSNIRAEFDLVGTGFDLVSAIFTALSPLASPTFTGTPSGPTAAPGTNTTQFATTAFVVASYAPIASPTFTGLPSGPTAAPGTSSSQLATTAFVATQAFSSALPGMSLATQWQDVTNDGTTARWGISAGDAMGIASYFGF